MDRRVVDEKLESLRRCLARVEARRPASVEALQADPDVRDILALNLTRAVQVSVDLAAPLAVPAPATMADAFRVLAEAAVISPEVGARMVAAVGFRNVAVHAYQAIDWAVVFAISHHHLGDFRAFARSVLLALPPA